MNCKVSRTVTQPYLDHRSINTLPEKSVDAASDCAHLSLFSDDIFFQLNSHHATLNGPTAASQLRVFRHTAGQCHWLHDIHLNADADVSKIISSVKGKRLRVFQADWRSAALRGFGYYDVDLLGKKVTPILPRILSRFDCPHQTVSDHYIIIQAPNKEQGRTNKTHPARLMAVQEKDTEIQTRELSTGDYLLNFSSEFACDAAQDENTETDPSSCFPASWRKIFSWSKDCRVFRHHFRKVRVQKTCPFESLLEPE